MNMSAITSLARFNLRQRLLLGIGAIILIFLLAVGYGWIELRTLGTTLARVVEVDSHRADQAQRLNAALLEMDVQRRTMLNAQDAEDLKAVKEDLLAAQQRYDRAETMLAESTRDPADPTARIVAAQLEKMREIRRAVQPMHDAAQASLESGGNASAALVMLLPAENFESQWRKAIATIVSEIDQSNEASFRQAQSGQRRAELLLAVACTLALTLGVAMAVALARGISIPVAHATKVTANIAAGDLDSIVEIGRSDEIGLLLRSVAAMQAKLREVVSRLRTASEVVVVSSGEIASASSQLSVRAEASAAQLASIIAEVQSLADQVRQGAGAADRAVALTHLAQEETSRSGLAATQMVDSIRQLSAAAKKIGAIVEIIEGIAAQTNILALNASVEAARAGDMGRGFSVVATEVRSLALRAADAAQQIKQVNNEAGSSVDLGERQAVRAGLAAATLSKTMVDVSAAMASILEIGQTQQRGLRTIELSVHRLDDLTQRNAAMSEETAAATGGLSDQANALTELVSMFKMSSAVDIGDDMPLTLTQAAA